MQTLFDKKSFHEPDIRVWKLCSSHDSDYICQHVIDWEAVTPTQFPSSTAIQTKNTLPSSDKRLHRTNRISEVTGVRRRPEWPLHR